MPGVVRPLLIGFLLGQLGTLTGAAAWTDDPGGLAAGGLQTVPPGPVAWGSAAGSEARADAVRAGQAGHNDQVVESLARAVLMDPTAMGTRRALGARLLAEQKVQAAIAQFEAVLRADPVDAVAYYELASALSANYQVDLAIESAQLATQLLPGWSEAHLRLGMLLLDSDRQAEGEAAIARALACSTVPPMVYYEVGNLYLNRGAPRQALPFFEAALRWQPNYSYAANNMGNAYKALNQPQDARRCYELAIEADPTNPNPHNALGVLLEEEGKPQAALKAYHKALEVNPRYADAHYNAGVLQLHQGKPAEALRELEAARALNPTLALIYVQLGEAHMRLGQLSQALASYRRANSLDPSLQTKTDQVQRLMSRQKPTP